MKPNLQVSLFKCSWDDVRKNGISKFQTELLFNFNLLSFNPKGKEDLEGYELTELIFLKTLYFDSGLPKEIVLSMLSALEKPYSYSLENICWDFKEKEWKYFPVLEESEIEKLIEKLEEDENYEKLKELKEFIEFKLKSNKQIKKKKRVCPKCKSGNVLRIQYGLPSKPIPSNVYLGGCCVTDEDPDWHCNDCSWEWGHNSEGRYNIGE